MKVSEIAKVINGKILWLKKDKIISSFYTDSRNIKKGDIFWALKGKRFDGNDFVEEAIEKGSSGIITSRKITSDNIKKLDFCILVKDTLFALHKLAAYHIKRCNTKNISITGSNGKTTTKEMIRTVLSTYKPTIYNRGNFNNEYGLPLSVLEAEKKHKFGVFEIGASTIGEVRRLARIIKPDLAVITTIAPEHLEFFKTMRNIFKTETEVIEELKKNGKIIINGDNHYLKRLKKNKNVISFGFSDSNDLIIQFDHTKAIFCFNGKNYSIKLKNHVRHNYLNAAAAFLAGKIMGVEIRNIISSLEKFEGVPLRMQFIKRHNSTIILDAYNANPQSMELALNEISSKGDFGAILGDMKELGKYSEKYHIELAKKILETKPKMLFLVGPEIKPCYDFLKGKIKNVKYYYDTNSALNDVRIAIKKNSNLNFLIKASRSMEFEKFIL
ncbi:MAG: UDP-N-acetylmuramoyl-tripeptide--D-alanyl-D-alanine ligase [Elusimicrobiota bacterium]